MQRQPQPKDRLQKDESAAEALSPGRFLHARFSSPMEPGQALEVVILPHFHDAKRIPFDSKDRL